MASNVNLHDIDIEDIGKLSVLIIKGVLKEHKQSTVGKKEVLVARTIALKSRLYDQTSEPEQHAEGKQSPFVDIDDKADITYDDIYKTAQGRVWADDLRKLCECNFHQLYDYLVVKTLKLNNEEMKGSSYKKLKSYCFFAEGNISNVEVCRGLGYVWVKAKVLASMKKIQYRVIVVFKSNGDINYAACQCPAGYVLIYINEHVDGHTATRKLSDSSIYHFHLVACWSMLTL